MTACIMVYLSATGLKGGGAGALVQADASTDTDTAKIIVRMLR